MYLKKRRNGKLHNITKHCSRRWFTAEWRCFVAVDLWSREETYRSGTRFDYLPPAEVLDEGEGLLLNLRFVLVNIFDFVIFILQLNFEFDFLDFDWDTLEGCSKRTFCGTRPPLQLWGVLLENVLWDSCPPCSCGSWFWQLVLWRQL